MASMVEFDAPETLESTAVVTSEIEAGEVESVTVAEVDSQGVDEDLETEEKTQPEEVKQVAADDSEDEDERTDEEIDLLDEILDASNECRKLEAVVELRKEEVKEAKSQLEQAVIRLRNVCSEIGTVRWMSRRRPKVAVEKPVDIATEVGEPSNGDPSQAPSESAADSWRSVSLATILEEKIKGFGTKKKDALLELCPTLGDFEDLRKRVGRDAAELHELLSDGIGLETASVIEERHLEWIAKNCQGASVQSEAGNITERAKQLFNGSDSCLDAKHPEGRNWHESGWTAFGSNFSLTDCPYIPGPEQDDWLRGWLAHQLADRIPDDDSNENQEVVEQPPVVEVVEQAEKVLLDDL